MATADFSQRNLTGIQATGLQGVKLANDDFIFAWINDGYQKMVLTTNQGQTIRDGWVRSTWMNSSTWSLDPSGPNFYSISNFQGTKSGKGNFYHLT